MNKEKEPAGDYICIFKWQEQQSWVAAIGKCVEFGGFVENQKEKILGR